MLRRTISQVLELKFNYERNTFANARQIVPKLPMKELLCGGFEVISVGGSGWLLAATPPEFNWPPPSK